MVNINAVKLCAKDDERGGAYRQDTATERNDSESSCADKPCHDDLPPSGCSDANIPEEGMSIGLWLPQLASSKL